jgi:hypothetical protein
MYNGATLHRQNGLSDPVRELDIPETKAQLFGLRLQQKNFLEMGVNVSFCRERPSNIAMYFSMDCVLVCCKDICGLMEDPQLQLHPELWVFFIQG